MAAEPERLTESALEVLKALIPSCPPLVLARLHKEHIATSVDLAGLDKDDLRELGLSMGQRNIVLRWAARKGHPQQGLQREPRLDDQPPPSDFLRNRMRISSRSPGEAKFLDSVEEQADFWCGLVVESLPFKLPSVCDEEGRLQDVRENMLEELFDLSPERVEQLFDDMLQKSTGKGQICMDALRQSLKSCGCPELNDASLSQIMRKLRASKDFDLAQFEVILSRLKLAQLLTGRCRLPGDQKTLTMRTGMTVTISANAFRRSRSSGSETTSAFLRVVDYDRLQASVSYIEGDTPLRQFFFGHRLPPRASADPPLVRWVHMDSLDLRLLLGLTVKYSLNAFSVEDTVEQCSTKLEQHGVHYFAAVEELRLVSVPDGSRPVQVQGHHLAIFCAGPPLSDTVITVTEQNYDETNDWPGGPVHTDSPGEDWAFRLRQRLEASHSRLRERRADFLMYQILDLCADEFVKVTRAYTTRLSVLEDQFNISALCGLHILPSWLKEVSLAHMQLTVVARRLRGLQRIFRRAVETPGLAADLFGYVSDIKEHIDEAQEDVAHLAKKCSVMIQSSERALEREQKAVENRFNERLNMMVFFLTAATAIFAPVQFLAGVYGMNFVNSEGMPTIPELLHPHGYQYFWIFSILYLMLSVSGATCVYRRFQNQTQSTAASHYEYSAVDSESESSSGCEH